MRAWEGQPSHCAGGMGGASEEETLMAAGEIAASLGDAVCESVFMLVCLQHAATAAMNWSAEARDSHNILHLYCKRTSNLKYADTKQHLGRAAGAGISAVTSP